MTSPTAINDIGDLLRILEERPEWTERLRAILLTREILELPERITQLTARVDHFIQAQEEFNRAQQETNARLDQRLDRLAAAQEATNARLDHFIQAQAAANARMDRRLENLEEFTRAQQEINARMDQRLANLEEFSRTQEEFNRAQQETNARMEQRLENLEEFNRKQEEFNRAQEEFNRKQEEFNRSQRETNAGVDRRLNNLENQVGSLLGSDLENRLHGNITSIAARNFNLRRVRILKSRFFPPDQNFYDRLYAAEDAGSITNEQSIQLQEADFILSAQEREAPGQIYLAVEVSRTVAARDITRARERADALRDATGVSSMALVIGNFIPEPEQARAREYSVTLIQQPPD